jgi:hypothetical protein
MKSAASVGALIQNILRQQGLDGRLREYRAWQVWDDVVGPQIAARARPVRIREGILEVRVDQAVWMQQLQLLKPKILVRLNERLEGATIRDLYLRRGKIERETPETPAPTPPSWQSASLTEAEESDIEAALAPLADPELRQSLRAILVRQAKLEKTGKRTDDG